MADQTTEIETVFISSNKMYEVHSNITHTEKTTDRKTRFTELLHDRYSQGFSKCLILPGVHKYPKTILEYDSTKTLLTNGLISILDTNR